MVTPADILNAKILVVDDKEYNVRLLEGMLRIAGYLSVSSTMNPCEVCDLYKANRYSLILLDLQMPVMDGFQVMEGLREIEGDGYLPVLVITAQPDHKLRALEAGARDFVGKPFDLAEMRARVHNVLEVRLLHMAALNDTRVIEETLRELRASNELVRLKTLEEQARHAAESSLAQKTQESLLPRTLPEFPNYRIRAYNNPTRYVGGDFYDFRELGSGEWVGVLADVSGKGMPAALLSSMVLGALNMEFRSATQPREALNRVNLLLCEKSLEDQFVTMFLFALRRDGGGHFISAGHNPAWVFRSASGTIERLVSTGFFLGMFDNADYESRPIHFDTGDILFVNSDGLTDAENKQEEIFGEERLLRIIRQGARSGGEAIERMLLSALEEFTEGTHQMDDVTFIVIEKR